MRIYSLSKILLLPVLLIAIGILYYGEVIGDRDSTVWVIIPGTMIVLIFIFAPQIDFWWHRRYPLPLDLIIRNRLASIFSTYASIDGSIKQKFENRLSLYLEAKEFKSVGAELHDVPEDIKALISYYPIYLTLNAPDFLIGHYDRIYLYKHAFPSPKMKFLHTVEIDHEDGVLLFSLEHALPGIYDPTTFFPIVLYGYLEALCYHHLWLDKIPNCDWEDIHEIKIYTQEHILQVTGWLDIDVKIILLVIYVVDPELVRSYDSAWYEKLTHLLTLPW